MKIFKHISTYIPYFPNYVKSIDSLGCTSILNEKLPACALDEEILRIEQLSLCGLARVFNENTLFIAGRSINSEVLFSFTTSFQKQSPIDKADQKFSY